MSSATAGVGIAGATVDCDSGLKATTGSYTITSVPVGSYTCTATTSGYRACSQSVTVDSRATPTSNFSLLPH